MRKSLLTKFHINRMNSARLAYDGKVHINGIEFPRLAIKRWMKGDMTLQALCKLISGYDNIKVVAALQDLKAIKERGEWPFEVFGPRS